MLLLVSVDKVVSCQRVADVLPVHDALDPECLRVANNHLSSEEALGCYCYLLKWS